MDRMIDPWRTFYFHEENNTDLCFDDPALRYLSDEQAKEWLKFSEFDNIHTLSNEIKLIDENIHKLPLLKENLVVIDLGCGDGIKSAQMLRLLRSHGAEISAYYVIDINQIFIDTAKQRICEASGLSQDRFFGYCTRIEDLSHLDSLPWSSSENVLYLFLGNTFNNFTPRKCSSFISKLLKPGYHMLIGAKIRSDSSENEYAKFIEEYEAFGTAFTFSFGHLLGLEDYEMKREVCYNHSINCIEIWLHLDKSLSPPNFPEIKSRKILVFRSFRPTAQEIINILRNFAQVSLWEAQTSNDVIIALYTA